MIIFIVVNIMQGKKGKKGGKGKGKKVGALKVNLGLNQNHFEGRKDKDCMSNLL